MLGMQLAILLGQYVAIILAVIAALLVLVVLSFLSRIGRSSTSEGEEVPVEEEEVIVPKKPARVVKSWEKYEPVESFEILYWRGVVETWRWNSFAKDLLQYADEHLPFKYVDFESYNASRQDVNYEARKRRIEQLRLKKIRNYPLVSINHDKEFYVINSSYAYKAICDRIQAEWDRHYGI